MAKQESLEAEVISKMSNIKMLTKSSGQDGLLRRCPVEEIARRQGSRALQLKEGDKKTKVLKGNDHKRCNNIDQLYIQGQTTKGANRIEGKIVDYYKKLYTKTMHQRPVRHFQNCPVLTTEEQQRLQG